jgi:hypothetical protein
VPAWFTVLPEHWRAALDRGELTLAAAEAAATLADLGPDHLDAMCTQLTGRNWLDPTRAVTNYRDDLRRAEQYARAVERARVKHADVFTNDDPPPHKAKRLGELFDADAAKAHREEPCHAVVVRRVGWGDGADMFDVCTDPRRHRPARGDTANGSDLTADNTRRRRPAVTPPTPSARAGSPASPTRPRCGPSPAAADLEARGFRRPRRAVVDQRARRRRDDHLDEIAGEVRAGHVAMPVRHPAEQFGVPLPHREAFDVVERPPRRTVLGSPERVAPRRACRGALDQLWHLGHQDVTPTSQRCTLSPRASMS